MNPFDDLSTDDYRALLTGDVEDYHDADGRPVGEIRASEPARRGVETELRTCPYQGSRHRHERPMNHTALRQATRDWPDILGTITLLRRDWMRTHRLERLGLIEYGRLAQVTALLPGYLLFRAGAPADRRGLSPYAASIHKMVTGIVSVVQLVALDAIARGASLADVEADPATLHHVAEASGLLAGRAGEVCAGPPGMIDDILRLYAGGEPRTRWSTAAIEREVADRAAFFRYADAATDLSFLTFVLGVRLDQLARGARPALPAALAGELDRLAPEALAAVRLRNLGDQPDVVREMVVVALLALIRDLDAPERAVLAAPGGVTAGDALASMRAVEAVALGAIDRQRRAIHAGLGRAAPARPLGLEELERLFGRSPSAILARAAA